jgi:hypothetical protein
VHAHRSQSSTSFSPRLSRASTSFFADGHQKTCMAGKGRPCTTEHQLNRELLCSIVPGRENSRPGMIGGPSTQPLASSASVKTSRTRSTRAPSDDRTRLRPFTIRPFSPFKVVVWDPASLKRIFAIFARHQRAGWETQRRGCEYFGARRFALQFSLRPLSRVLSITHSKFDVLAQNRGACRGS